MTADYRGGLPGATLTAEQYSAIIAHLDDALIQSEAAREELYRRLLEAEKIIARHEEAARARARAIMAIGERVSRMWR